MMQDVQEGVSYHMIFFPQADAEAAEAYRHSQASVLRGRA